jgi:ankyrin repeat protein
MKDVQGPLVVALAMLLITGCAEPLVEEGPGTGPPGAVAAPVDGTQGSSKPKAAAANPSSSPDLDVWTSVVTGNVEFVKQHLAAGTDANIKDPNGAPILNAAAVYGHRDIVDALIQKRANINGKDKDGNSALHAAAFLGRTEVVELLLEKGVDANIKNNKGETPTDALKVDWGTTQFIAGLLQIQVDQQSVQAGRNKSAALLAKRGGKVGAVGSAGGGLIGAIRKQDVAAVKQALAEKADPNGQDSEFGVIALNWAALIGNVEIAEILLAAGADVNGKSRDGGAPLSGAAFMGRADVCELLLSKGGDPKQKNAKGEDPLVPTMADAGTTQFIAGLLKLDYDLAKVQAGRAKCVELLKNGTGGKELSAAVRKQDVAAVKQLLAKSKKNANSRDPDLGITALAWAAYHGNVEIAGLLIAAGADVNGKNEDGSRPLHAAAFTGHSAVLGLLLKQGAVASAKNADDETPLQMTEADLATTRVAAGLLQVKLDAKAFAQGRARCIELLKQKPATP